ncbi:MAG: hypothetical protein AB1611_02915 [bacterium]
MKFQNRTSYTLISLGISIFLLTTGSSRLVHAKDTRSSPLFEESLQETLREFNAGTRKIGKKSGVVQSRSRIEEDEGPFAFDREISYDFETFLEDVNKAKLLSLLLLGHTVKSVIKNPVLYVGAANRAQDPQSLLFSCWPTFWGSTCRGFTCTHAFPTLIGRTCSVTCGLRSTCRSGWFCRHHPSPCAEVDNLNRLAQENGKPITLTIF